MSTIKYQIKTQPYEVKSTFGGAVKIKDVRDEVIEFDIADLTEEQRELFLSSKPFWGSPTERELVTYRVSGANLARDPYVAEQSLSLDEAFAILAEHERTRADLQAQIDAQQEELRKQREEEAKQRRQAQEEHRARKEEEQQRRFEEAHTVKFNENGKAIINLYNQVRLVSRIEMDTRFQSNWIKRVTAVDTSKTTGYAFEGEWVRDETIEITNEPAAFLVAGTSGSRKNNSTDYRVVVLRDGRLEATDIEAINRNGGWALLIRDRLAELLVELGITQPEVVDFTEILECINTDTESVTVSRELLAKLAERAGL